MPSGYFHISGGLLYLLDCAILFVIFICALRWGFASVGRFAFLPVLYLCNFESCGIGYLVARRVNFLFQIP